MVSSLSDFFFCQPFDSDTHGRFVDAAASLVLVGVNGFLDVGRRGPGNNRDVIETYAGPIHSMTNDTDFDNRRWFLRSSVRECLRSD